MADLAHLWGGDLSASATGDLAVVGGDGETQQRILRRLLTNPQDYLWRGSYGAGLPAKVGSVSGTAQIQALTQGQMRQEGGVAAWPAPTAAVTALPTGLSADLRYWTASGGVSALSFSVSG